MPGFKRESLNFPQVVLADFEYMKGLKEVFSLVLASPHPALNDIFDLYCFPLTHFESVAEKFGISTEHTRILVCLMMLKC